MTPTDPRHLIGGYVTGTLNKTELDYLLRCALEDQALYDELMDQEPIRRQLNDREYRRELISHLSERLEREPLPVLERLRRFLHKPYVRPVLSVAFTVALLLAVRQGLVRPDTPAIQVVLGPAGAPALSVMGLFETREGEPARLREVIDELPRRNAGATILLDRTGATPSYRSGDKMRLGFTVAEDAAAMLIEARADGTVVRLFPNRLQPEARVNKAQQILIPPAGQGDISVDGPAGRRTLRLLLFPSGVDPLDPSHSWASLRTQATVTEMTYEVTP